MTYIVERYRLDEEKLAASPIKETISLLEELPVNKPAEGCLKIKIYEVHSLDAGEKYMIQFKFEYENHSINLVELCFCQNTDKASLFFLDTHEDSEMFYSFEALRQRVIAWWSPDEAVKDCLAIIQIYRKAS